MGPGSAMPCHCTHLFESEKILPGHTFSLHAEQWPGHTFSLHAEQWPKYTMIMVCLIKSCKSGSEIMDEESVLYTSK